MRTRPIVFGVFLLLSSLACGEGSRPAPFSVADSAGVAIATNSPQALEEAPAWTLGQVPVVSIGGGVNAADPLFRVTAVLPVGDSLVAVGLGSPPRALLFSRSGARVSELGRPGDGPGEFRSLGSVVEVAPGVIGVWDPYRRRLSHFDLEAVHLRDLELTRVVPPAPGSVGSTEETAGYTHVFATEGGYAVFSEGALGPGPETGAYRPQLPSVSLNRRGEVEGRYGVFPGMAVVAPSGLPQPFGARSYATVVGNRLVVGTGHSAEYRILSSGGALLRVVRWPHESRPAEGAFPDRWARLRSESAGLAEIVAELPLPIQLPTHGEIVSGDDGWVFVSEYPGPVGLLSTRRADDAPEVARPLIPVPERRWLVFSSEGELRATLDTPEGFEPAAVVDGVMWGVFEDALGVESVRAYPIVRTDGVS